MGWCRSGTDCRRTIEGAAGGVGSRGEADWGGSGDGNRSAPEPSSSPTVLSKSDERELGERGERKPQQGEVLTACPGPRERRERLEIGFSG